jgi:hypothetical protein
MRRLTYRLLVFIVALCAGLGLSVGAWASFTHSYRYSGNTSVDGASANVRGNSFNPRNNQCVLYAIVMRDFTNGQAQMEAMLPRCDDGTTIDAQCHNGFGALERLTASGVAGCDQGNSFVNDTDCYGWIQRRSSSSTIVDGGILNASLPSGADGFFLSDTTRVQGWGEATGGTACPTSAHSGHIGFFSKYLYGDGWSLVTQSNKDSDAFGFGPCWTVEAVGPNGGFDVD